MKTKEQLQAEIEFQLKSNYRIDKQAIRLIKEKIRIVEFLESEENLL